MPAAACASASLDFQGTWEVDRISTPAWIATPMPRIPAFVRISFQEERVEAAAPVGCVDVRYEVVELPPEGLFQGYIADPAAAAMAARALHLSQTAAPTLRVVCDTGVFDYHLDQHGDLVIMVDNVIYHLARQSTSAKR